jgi:dUTPase
LYVPNVSNDFVKDLVEKNPGQPVRWSIVGTGPTEKDADPNEGYFIQVAPHCDILIPSYIKARFTPDICLRVSNKGSIATKKKLICGAEIVDTSYQGIIYIHLINTSSTLQFIEFGKKMCQLVPVRIDNSPFEVFYDNHFEQFKDLKNFIDPETFYTSETARGEGAFGSTGS